MKVNFFGNKFLTYCSENYLYALHSRYSMIIAVVKTCRNISDQFFSLVRACFGFDVFFRTNPFQATAYSHLAHHPFFPSALLQSRPYKSVMKNATGCIFREFLCLKFSQRHLFFTFLARFVSDVKGREETFFPCKLMVSRQ